ncbi:hypothetical protein FBEOM_8708 [Fusarium beomiforme]|uniref:Uncharacterized protein n=1 Tax=Fusarium beomiforme TaxID=44412 RepID=A0A9P5AET3_9HYPO|nr:hypothetical protein FBEOM_8708 [Fusarium beomiforme]
MLWAHSLQASFRLLDGFLKSGQLDPSTSQAAAHALRCLTNCENGLKELSDFGDKLSASNTPDRTVKDKVRASYHKLTYPLRQTHLMQLGNALDNLCTPVNLAVQGLQLEMQAASSSALIVNTSRVQQTADQVSTLTAAVSRLNDPVSNIQSQLPSLQTSVDAVAPQISLMIQAQLKSQMEDIKLSIREAESTSLQLHAETNELLSQLRIDARNPNPALYRLTSKPSALATVASSVSTCSCRMRRLRTRKALRYGPLYLVDELTTDIAHYKDCKFNFTDPKCTRSVSLRSTGLSRLINKAVELTLHTTTGAGGFSISPSFTYFAEVDARISPAFRVMGLLMANRLGVLWAVDTCPEHFFNLIICKLQAIFRSGKARPTDTSDGRSLLHMLVCVINYGSLRYVTEKQRSHPGLKSVFDFLIAAGTPSSAVDSRGCLAFHDAATELQRFRANSHRQARLVKDNLARLNVLQDFTRNRVELASARASTDGPKEALKP